LRQISGNFPAGLQIRSTNAIFEGMNMPKISFFLVLPALILAAVVNPLNGQNPEHIAGIVLSGHNETDFKNVVAWLYESDGISQIQHRDPVIRFRYDTEENRLAAMEKLLHRSFSVSSKNGIPPDFPANPDHPDYDAQKSLWIENNAQRYDELNQQTSVITISQQEFDLLTPQKQQFILDRPDQYQIVP
jgi:hypothetical protein